jgi:hypothetical protein
MKGKNDKEKNMKKQIFDNFLLKCLKCGKEDIIINVIIKEKYTEFCCNFCGHKEIIKNIK